MRYLVLSAVLACVVLSGCAVVPDVEPKREKWFEADTDLANKEKKHYRQTLEQIDEFGLLCYDAYLPWPDEFANSQSLVDNYRRSHNVADAPAWHGCLMAALAYKEAVSGEDQDDEIHRLALGLMKMFVVTGEPGLLARSYLAGYDGPRLDWMDTPEDRPTKHWRRGDGGWFRTGAAKNHLNLAMYGCAIPLALDKKGDIELKEETKVLLETILVATVRRLAENQYRMIGWNGKPTEFGDLRPSVVPQEYIDMVKPYVGILPWDISADDLDNLSRPLNGFNMTIVLALLRAAGEYDPYLMDLYQQETKAWGKTLGLSLQVVGYIISRIGHYKLGKPSYSDMAAIGQAASVLLMHEPDSKIAADVSRGLGGLWQYVRYERNPMFAFTYLGMLNKGEEPERIEEIIEDLRDFPNKKQAHFGPNEESESTQPLRNRKISSHYWKSDPNGRITGEQIPHEGRFYSAQDYLLAYWWGRYLELVPEK